eukprot:scaffold128768_cov15-Tisochrysis_lutea.AAC.1
MRAQHPIQGDKSPCPAELRHPSKHCRIEAALLEYYGSIGDDGQPEDVARLSDSLTAQYASGEGRFSTPVHTRMHANMHAHSSAMVRSMYVLIHGMKAEPETKHIELLLLSPQMDCQAQCSDALLHPCWQGACWQGAPRLELLSGH